jgi:hypothetical protein
MTDKIDPTSRGMAQPTGDAGQNAGISDWSSPTSLGNSRWLRHAVPGLVPQSRLGQRTHLLLRNMYERRMSFIGRLHRNWAQPEASEAGARNNNWVLRWHFKNKTANGSAGKLSKASTDVDLEAWTGAVMGTGTASASENGPDSGLRVVAAPVRTDRATSARSYITTSTPTVWKENVQVAMVAAPSKTRLEEGVLQKAPGNGSLLASTEPVPMFAPATLSSHDAWRLPLQRDTATALQHRTSTSAGVRQSMSTTATNYGLPRSELSSEIMHSGNYWNVIHTNIALPRFAVTSAPVTGTQIGIGVGPVLSRLSAHSAKWTDSTAALGRLGRPLSVDQAPSRISKETAQLSTEPLSFILRSSPASQAFHGATTLEFQSQEGAFVLPTESVMPIATPVHIHRPGATWSAGPALLQSKSSAPTMISAYSTGEAAPDQSNGHVLAQSQSKASKENVDARYSNAGAIAIRGPNETVPNSSTQAGMLEGSDPLSKTDAARIQRMPFDLPEKFSDSARRALTDDERWHTTRVIHSTQTTLGHGDQWTQRELVIARSGGASPQPFSTVRGATRPLPLLHSDLATPGLIADEPIIARSLVAELQNGPAEAETLVWAPRHPNAVDNVMAPTPNAELQSARVPAEMPVLARSAIPVEGPETAEKVSASPNLASLLVQRRQEGLSLHSTAVTPTAGGKTRNFVRVHDRVANDGTGLTITAALRVYGDAHAPNQPDVRLAADRGSGVDSYQFPFRQRVYARQASVSNAVTSPLTHIERSGDGYDVVPNPSESSRVSGGESRTASATADHPGDKRQELDEITEQVWHSIMNKLLIEQERRGIGKWP